MNLSPRTRDDLARMHGLVFPGIKAPLRKRDLIQALARELSESRVVKVAYPRISKSSKRHLLTLLRCLDWERLGNQVKGPYARSLATAFSNAQAGQRAVGITLGVTRGIPGTHGFDASGINRRKINARIKGQESALEDLWSTMEALLRKTDPQFRFTSMQVNFNFPAERSHVDRHNRGPSYALSLGRFSGGRLIAGTDDPWTLVSFNTKDRLTFCDARHPHWVAPYTGERYSLICYRVLGRKESRQSNLACAPESAKSRGAREKTK